jgi:hypothetical protein
MNISRRSLVQSAALALAEPAIPLTQPLAAVGPERHNYFNKGTRLTISMWDFSWLMAHHPGGAYENLERRVVEARERGYNTLRIDCFPSRVLERESTVPAGCIKVSIHEETCSTGAISEFGAWPNASAYLPQWGQRAATFWCNVRKAVAELGTLCEKHGLWLGLDSWDKAHMFGHTNPIASADEERELTAYGKTWAKALRLLREDGVLERAVWVAPMNEVPHFGSRYLVALTQQHRLPVTNRDTEVKRSHEEDAVYRRINHWMALPIKDEIARDQIPLSYSSLGERNFSTRLTDIYDVVDVHFMPDVVTDPEDQAAFSKATRGVTEGGPFARMAQYDLKQWSWAWDRACRKHYGRMLERSRDFLASARVGTILPSGKRLAAVITEAFGPCFWPDHPDVSWDWYKRYNADCLRLAATIGFEGTSLSNYAEPLFSLWNDADWHWTSNAYFLAIRG